MATPESKRVHDEAPSDLGRPLLNDVLVIKNMDPDDTEIQGGLYFLIILLSGGIVWLTFSSEWRSEIFSLCSEHPVVTSLIGGLYLWMVYFGLASRREISIDFSQRSYQVRRGTWPFVRTQTGNLSEVNHLRLSMRYKPTDRPGSGVDIMRVTMVWTSNHPSEFCLKAFNHNAQAKKELEVYAAQFAARLQLPIVDDVEA